MSTTTEALRMALTELKALRAAVGSGLQTDEAIAQAEAALAAAPRVSLSAAARDVLAERLRQVEVEGWTPKHDDEHSTGAMAAAAACYALTASAAATQSRYWIAKRAEACRSLWPWASVWWKPKDQRSDLVRAGALILAEIERLDRAAPKPEGGA